MEREFPLDVVLTVTCGRFVASPDGLQAVREFLGFLLGKDLPIAEIEKATYTCRPHLATQHPTVCLPAMSRQVVFLDHRLATAGSFERRAEVVREWVDEQAKVHGAALMVTPIPSQE